MERVRRKQFRIGEAVKVHLGPTTWRGRIVEDRGRLGKGGLRLFRVELLADQQEGKMFVEVGKDEIEAAGA